MQQSISQTSCHKDKINAEYTTNYNLHGSNSQVLTKCTITTKKCQKTGSMHIIYALIMCCGYFKWHRHLHFNRFQVLNDFTSNVPHTMANLQYYS